MNIRNCRVCGRIFNYVAGPIACPVCREKAEAKFQQVKEYIRENPGVGIAEVSAVCEVDAAQIRQWLRDERLELAENSPIYMNCESCGAPIRCGRYCEQCKNHMANTLRSVIHEEKPRQQTESKKLRKDANAKMRYFN